MDSAAPAFGRKGPRLLIVSPSGKHLSLLARRLGEEGFRIAAADSGSAALAELHRAPADLVLSELLMGPMSGIELTRAIRGETMWRDLPIMLIAGKADPDGAVRAYEAGADDVILKPFFFEILTARIERRLASASALRQLRTDNATLDARIAERAIELGELRDRFRAITAERGRSVQKASPF